MLLKPGTENEEYASMVPNIDKLLHFLIFFALGFLYKLRFPNTKLKIFLLLLVSYALLTEILQETMGFGRSLEILDAIADTLGLLLSYFMYNIIREKFFKN